MLINVVEPEEGRIAVVENGTLEELYVERTSSDRTVGNIYKGKVTNVEPGIQAAFIDIGLNKNGFLHASDVVLDRDGEAPEEAEEDEDGRPRHFRRHRPRVPIQQLVHRGEEVLVQITRAGLGNKGPSLTTHISLPGRFLVLMPMDRHFGISRKIMDEKLRGKLRKVVDDLSRRSEYGFIVRTAGAEVGKREIQRDLRYLTNLWQEMEVRSRKAPSPVILYTESDLVIRSLRDVLTPEMAEIVIDDEEEAKKVRDFLSRFPAAGRPALKLYTGTAPLFHKYGVETQVEQISQPKIPLSQGGSIVIQQTEAMVAIDVNSGRFVEEQDPEETAYKTNMEAAPQIARQLRLRDLGGVIVIDFIDMRQERHKRDVERALSQAMKRDRARATTLRMSRFCIVEMTRQRVRTSLERATYQSCPACSGRGIVKTVESMAIGVMRQIKIALHRQAAQLVEAIVHPEVALYMQNKKRQELSKLETETQRVIIIRGDTAKGLEMTEVLCYLDDGARVRV